MTHEIIGYHTPEEVICPECYEYLTDKLTAENDEKALAELVDNADPTTFESYPDGFTCADCGEVVTP